MIMARHTDLTREANRVLIEYRDGGTYDPVSKERARIRIQSIIEQDGRRMGGAYALMYYADQLNRIEEGRPIQTLREWTGLHPKKD